MDTPWGWGAGYGVKAGRGRQITVCEGKASPRCVTEGCSMPPKLGWAGLGWEAAWLCL